MASNMIPLLLGITGRCFIIYFITLITMHTCIFGDLA
ncbi:unnamed protein product [Rhodiola kirilowii]